MSQPQKRDIADFFRPFAKTIPQKRPTPDLDDDTIVVRSGENPPRTPSTSRKVDQRLPRQNRATPTHPRASPLQTPKSGKSVSIPIRSPAGGSALKPASARKPLFDFPATTSQGTPKASSSFSFADAPATSRKVVEDGKVVEVRDSDDSDNESLQSLTDIFAQKSDGKGHPKSSQTDVSSKHEEERRSLLSLYTGGRSNPILKKDRLKELHRLEQANKFDFGAILDDDRKDEERRAALAKANAELEESSSEADEGKQAERDKKMLAAILQDNSADEIDDEDMSRLVGAVERTEAFTAEKTFSFFRKEGPRNLSGHKKAKKEFPASPIPGSLWHHRDIAARDRAYLSGFVTELAEYGTMDDQALRWTFDAVLTEQRDDLRQSYIDTVAAASSSWTRSNVTPGDIQDIFDMLRADSHALRDGSPIEARRRLNHESYRQDYNHLLAAIKLMDCVCADMDFAALSKLTSISCRLALDQQLMSNNLVCRAVEFMLNKLTNLTDSDSRAHVHDRLLSDLGSNLTEPSLQVHFLSHFVPTTSQAAKFRSRLASIFLFGIEFTQKLFKPSSSSLSPLARITSHLSKDPLFTNTRSLSTLQSTNVYPSLGAKTQILDAATTDGFRPASFSSRSEQQHFDADVDALAEHIHTLFVSIIDTGASHMSRTEAKAALQALHYRLLYQVRTKTKRKRHVFDREGAFNVDGSNAKKIGKGGIRDAFEVEGTKKSGDFMSKFLKKKTTIKTLEPDATGEEKDMFVDVHEL
ncbi:hypothetical protein PMZ80_006129 [Knufia obscura]|uniref:Uncharacterized protein n=2 Tax=Knufia TaxID=430999 RepID=A0AAN8I504_9EURO|nr:hypothetical protein PMZ80_006129 [Knufia obscura]KAK5954797.1 hypothetical protein OHC33_004523 [Knufia fluminis]